MSIPLLIAYVISLLVMIGLPIAAAFFVVRKFKQSWLVVLTGVITFIVGLVMHRLVQDQVSVLFNTGKLTIPSATWQPLVAGGVVGLLAGLFEELSRMAGFLVIQKKADKFGSSLALGAGHGGIQSILMAVWPWWPLSTGVLISVITLVFYNPGAQIAKGVSLEHVQEIIEYIQWFWTTPWHFGLLPGIERLMMFVAQVLFSILVWKAVAYRSAIWFILAVIYHAIIEALPIFLSQLGWDYWPMEGVSAIFLVLNLFLIYRFWKEEQEIEAEMDELELSEDDQDEDDSEDLVIDGEEQ